MKKEIRNISSPLEIRKGEGGEDSRRVEGYALVFDSRSEDLGGFTEIIKPEAMQGVLERSDVLALLDHNITRGVLARYRKGGGSLDLSVDEKGLRYSFDAPNTALGDELIEGIKRGDISGSSFAFTVEKEEWEEVGDGQYSRTILRFGQLFDVSPVYHPAYSATSVETDTRGLDALKLEIQKRSEKKDPECKSEEEPKDDESKDSEKKSEEAPKDEEQKDSEKNSNEDQKEDNDTEKEEKENKEEDKRNNNSIPHTSMKKQPFSILRAISAVVNKETMDDSALYVNEIGKRAIIGSGQVAEGEIFIPFSTRSEKRYEETPNGIVGSQNPEALTHGGEAVPTELFDLMGPLRDKLVVAQLGARMLNLKGNVEIPIYSGANVFWESEIGTAQDGAGTFKTVKMSPKRITAFLAISKQWLIQSDPSAEALVRQDIINSVTEKLQRTMFGAGPGDNITPAGLFNGVNPDDAPFAYKDAVEMEAALEGKNVYGEFKYVVSPSAKALLRQTNIDKGSGRFVMENNEILGVKTLSTGSVVTNGLILADWSQFYVATFGGLDITVDPYTLAGNGQIRLVVNAWFDYLPVRPEAFVKRILK